MAPYFNKIKLFEFFPKDDMDYFANIVKRAIEMRKESKGIQGKVYLWYEICTIEDIHITVT